ncbi:MAG: hypothetical protein PHC84_05310 [Clostridia bacterium]|nr:hypothetical protein [Clostridia bacterium]
MYKNVRYQCGINKIRAVFRFESEDSLAKELVSEAVLFFYKYKELSKTLEGCGLKNMCYYAYIGALLSIDFSQEKVRLIEEMHKLGGSLSVDGFYNFCGAQFRENWKNLAQLAYKLYSQCKNDEDAYELTTFMLGVDGEGEAVMVIDNNSGLRLIKNKQPVPLIGLFDREEFNVIATVLSHRPTNIIVVKPEKMEPSLMKAIHSLGD